MPDPTVALIVRADNGTAPLNAPVTLMTNPVGAGPLSAGSQNRLNPLPALRTRKLVGASGAPEHALGIEIVTAFDAVLEPTALAARSASV